MNRPIGEIAFAATVKTAQEKRGSRASYARMEHRSDPGPWGDVVTPEFAAFIDERDSLLFWQRECGWSTVHPVPRRS